MNSSSSTRLLVFFMFASHVFACVKFLSGAKEKLLVVVMMPTKVTTIYWQEFVSVSVSTWPP
jgi:hypothetical protein